MPNTAVTLPHCPYPVTFDTYKGCSHNCKYCFTNFRAGGLHTGEDNVKVAESAETLEKWCRGERSRRNNWIDWRIPLCFGRNSDPFQPIERREKASLAALKVFAKYGYPFILTTKGVLPAHDKEYLAVLKDCNVCWQQSMCCDNHDELEPGAPKFAERLEAIHTLSQVVPRLVVRCQPLFLELWRQTMRNFKAFKDAGAYAVHVQTATLLKPRGMCREFNNNCYWYAMEDKIPVYEAMRRQAHGVGLQFLTGDIRDMSDSLECCGCAGMKDFEPNRCNEIFRKFGKKGNGEFAVRQRQLERGTGEVFQNVFSGRRNYDWLKNASFYEVFKTEFIDKKGGE